MSKTPSHPDERGDTPEETRLICVLREQHLMVPWGVEVKLLYTGSRHQRDPTFADPAVQLDGIRFSCLLAPPHGMTNSYVNGRLRSTKVGSIIGLSRETGRPAFV